MIQAEVKEKSLARKDSGNYSENGLIYQSCLKKYSLAKEKLMDLGEEMIRAIEKKVWLGFLHPASGQFCSFIAYDEAGQVSDSISFKLWLASDPKVGGLGIQDLSVLSGMLKQNKKSMARILPMLADGDSIREANKILESQGQAPLMEFGKQKEYYLKKINAGPENFKNFIALQDIPLYFACTATGQYLSKIGDNPELEKRLNQVIAKYPDECPEKKKEIIQEIEIALGMDQVIQLRLIRNKPEQMAQKIAENIEKDQIQELISQLESILDEE